MSRLWARNRRMLKEMSRVAQSRPMSRPARICQRGTGVIIARKGMSKAEVKGLRMRPLLANFHRLKYPAKPVPHSLCQTLIDCVFQF